MELLFDSFRRAAIDCLRPRVIALSLLPLLLVTTLALGWGYFQWNTAVQRMRSLLDTATLPMDWLQTWGLEDVSAVLAVLMVLLVATPVLAMGALVLVALLMTPALVAMVAKQRFPALERKRGGSFMASLARSVGATGMALVLLLISIPLWLLPPLALVLPPLIWGWLTYQVVAFDALATHASQQERQEIFRHHRARLLGMGILAGYLGTAPAIVWASGLVFAAAFPLLVPLAVWMYTMLFAFSSLWFTHYGLTALQRLRAEGNRAHRVPAA